MDDSVETVKLLYPNEWRKNISELGIEPGVFNWFLCSKRMFDEKKSLFYISVSPDVQFYNEVTGETLLARGLKNPPKDNELVGSTKRAKLLILSDPHNKKTLCRNYGLLCGCDSDRDILSTECNLVTNKKLLRKCSRKAMELGFDGAVVKHDCSKKCLGCVDNPICENATFLFRKLPKILEPVTEPERCGIIRYSKKNNLCIRKLIPNFPTVEQINILLKKRGRTKLSQELLVLVHKYLELKSK
jgi:hypothetical protein